MHHPTDRIIHTTAFVTPVVEHWLEREIAQWVHPMKDRSDVDCRVQLLRYAGVLIKKYYISMRFELAVSLTVTVGRRD